MRKDLIEIPRIRGALQTFSAVIICFGFFSSSLVAQTKAFNSLTPSDIARLVTEAPRVTEAALSPDGRSVAYTVGRASVADNMLVFELLLQPLVADGSALGEPRSIYRVSHPGKIWLNPKWRPDGKAISYLAIGSSDQGNRRSLVVYDVATGQVGKEGKMDINDTVENPVQTVGPGKGTPRPRITSIGPNYKWSPSGRYVAFTSTLKEPDRRRLDSRGGVVRTMAEASSPLIIRALFLYEVSSGSIRQLTPDTMSVESFDWSPDETRLVFENSYNSRGRIVNGDPGGVQLYLTDLRTGAIRDLVKLPGNNKSPVFSPDGEWVAFAGQFRPRMGHPPSWPAVVSVETGTITRLAKGDEPKVIDDRGTFEWTSDSRSFYYQSAHHMAWELVRADVPAKRVTLVNEEDNYTDDGLSFAADRSRAAFVRSTFDEPPELYIQNLPGGKPKRVTNVGATFPLRGSIRTERVSWQSKGLKTIHGYLLTPRSAWGLDGAALKAPLPTVVYNYGGPSMVTPHFDINEQKGVALALAVRGYAVLLPNTRPRSGYGDLEAYAALNGGEYRLAFEDIMTGIDMLIERGMADRTRLGAGGHSFGANMLTYLITRTERLKAAQLHEATRLDSFIVPFPGTGWEVMLYRRYGITDPLTPKALKQFTEDAPRLSLHKIKTPTLLQFGEGTGGNANNVGETLFNAMVRLKIPHEFVVYDDGHATSLPGPMADNIIRVSDWFDYWLRDMPYPDKEREKEFNAWRAKQRSDKQVKN